MYLNYFGLAEAPFSIAPAPRFLYMSQRHQEALAHLLYGLQGEGGFVLLTGEVGAGKTTVCRSLLEQIPETCDVAYIFNPKLTVEELLSTICVEFGIDCPAGNSSIKVFIDRINAHLLDAHARGRQAVLIIDEAQNLAPDVLEQMRLLTNLETSERKLLQIILLGQPELAHMLARPELRQLAQRIVARYHLGPLTRQEVAAYVRHRLAVAGTPKPLFPDKLMGRLHRLSGGVPRVVNVLCDRALLGAFVQGKERIDRHTLAQAAREVLPGAAVSPPPRRWAMAAGVLLAAGGTWLLTQTYRPTAAPLPAQAVAPAVPAAPAGLRPVPSPVLEWPPGEPVSGSEASAFASLHQAWGTLQRPGDPCREAEASGLRCRSGRGTLEELRQINRPAVLSLRDRDGREFHGLLTHLTGDRATFRLGAQARTVTLDALAERWTGGYTLFWRPPLAVQDTLRPGDRGAAVVWLKRQLDRLDGLQAAQNPEPRYDEALKRRVKQYQFARGLVPDGSFGQQTLIRLLGETDSDAPSLGQDRSGDAPPRKPQGQ